MATKINSYSKVLIRNTKEPDREAWLDLPFSEDEFLAFRLSVRR